MDEDHSVQPISTLEKDCLHLVSPYFYQNILDSCTFE